MIKIKFNEKTYEVNNAITIDEFIKNFNIDNNNIIVATLVNNIKQDFSYVIQNDCVLNFIDTTSTIGQKIYKTSLSLLFIKAVYDVLNKAKVELCHTISKGQYCEIQGYKDISDENINLIKARMIELIKMDLPIKKTVMSKEDAIELFSYIKKFDYVELLKTIYKEAVDIYSIDGYLAHFNNYIVPSTGYIKDFRIVKEDNGIVLLCPSKKNPKLLEEYKKQQKLLNTFKETKKWGQIMDVAFVSDLNKKVLNNKYGELIRTIESLHERKISEIADVIYKNNHRIILIAGPSSSGKTSTAKRLAIQLRVLGLDPISISVDDYFLNRNKTPLDKNGEKDYESIYAIDLEQFNKDLNTLLNGDEIDIPSYNFIKGEREYNKGKLKINNNQPIIIEGIHGLNPLLTKSIPENEKFKIYISPITQLNLDIHNRVSSTDARLIRRIVRDFKFRGHDAIATLKMWESVRSGEDKNIFPYQEEADVIFNSTLFYELNVLKKYAVPLLIAVTQDNKYYTDAKRLLNLLSYFVEISDELDIPPTSILREFIGNSRLLDE